MWLCHENRGGVFPLFGVAVVVVVGRVIFPFVLRTLKGTRCVITAGSTARCRGDPVSAVRLGRVPLVHRLPARSTSWIAWVRRPYHRVSVRLQAKVLSTHDCEPIAGGGVELEISIEYKVEVHFVLSLKLRALNALLSPRGCTAVSVYT